MVDSLGASGETIVRRSRQKHESALGCGAHEFELTNKATSVPSRLGLFADMTL